MPLRVDGPHRYRTAAAAVATALIVAACGPTAPSPAPTGTSGAPTVAPSLGPSASAADPATVYAAIAAQVEQIRGLQPKGDIAPVEIDAAQLVANLKKDFDDSNPKTVVENSQRELIALGLLPPGADLRALVLDLESGQVAGYYSPKDKQLFVVNRGTAGVGPTQRVTYSHEFTHELQDQNFGLAKLDLQARDQGDRSLAHLSLIEGDAVSVQSAWMQTGLTASDLTQVLGDALDPAGLAALQRAPAILQQTSLFPYTTGLTFVQVLIAEGRYDAVNQAFANPPASTEQIMHPDKYTAHEPPVVVKPPPNLAGSLGAGWTEAAQDTFGEFQLKVWLQQGGVDVGTAATATAGWGGDRLVLFTGPNGATELAIITVWDTPNDAVEFSAALGTAFPHYAFVGAASNHTTGSKTVSIVIGPNGAALLPVLPS
jgi:hypothetical protein